MTSLSIGSILPGAAAAAAVAVPAPLAAASGAGTVSRDTALSYAPDSSSVNALAGAAASAAAQQSSAAAGSITMPALQLTPVQQQPTTAPNSGGQNAPSSVVFQDAADPDAAP
jgi:hypothetical protein